MGKTKDPSTATVGAACCEPLKQALMRVPIIAIIRTDSPEEALWTAEQALAGGLAAIEIAFTTPSAAETLSQLRQQHPEAWIGAASLLGEANTTSAVAAGARFLVSPTLDKKAMAVAREAQIPYIPGIFTPTEAQRAVDKGAEILKLFPAQQAGGPGFIRAIRAPMPHLSLIATGGVTPGNITDYLTQGALAVGMGAALFDENAVRARDAQCAQQGIRQMLERIEAPAIQAARPEQPAPSPELVTIG